MRIRPLALLFAAITLGTTPVAARPFVVLQDDGTIEDQQVETAGDLEALRAKLLSLYAETGADVPEVLSVWSNFSVGTSYSGTYFDQLGNSVSGIGITENTSPEPPLDAVLWHNDFTRIPQRATRHRSPEEGFGTYLFLLELSHLWGPNLSVPQPNSRSLIGFYYHWSFFLSPPSPAGGNEWTDNGDGSFTIVPQLPSQVRFSPIDLYLMGLSAPADVAPFQVLEDVDVPSSPTDPLWGGPFAAHSFPWFDQDQTLTITATPRTVSIDDIVATNGERVPAAGQKTTWRVGFVLLVSSKDDAAAIASDADAFSALAAEFAPSFETATSSKGSLDVVTEGINQGGTGGEGAGGANTGGEGSGGEGASAGDASTGGASTGGASTGGASTGGASTGGASTGGVNTDDAIAGGEDQESDGCGCKAAGKATTDGLGWVAVAGLIAGAFRKRKGAGVI